MGYICINITVNITCCLKTINYVFLVHAQLPSFTYLIHEVNFVNWCLAPNLLMHSCNNFSHFLFSGPKWATSRGWRTSVTWGGNFRVTICWFSASLITGMDICVTWPSKRSSSGCSSTLSVNFKPLCKYLCIHSPWCKRYISLTKICRHIWW